MAEDANAILAINGGGFLDQNGLGNGGLAQGILIKDGKILSTHDNIIPECILRTNSYHDNILDDLIVSASNIREKFENNLDISKYIPEGKLNNINYDLLFNLYAFKLSFYLLI